MKRQLAYERLDGVIDKATLEVRKEGRCFSGYITIGTLRKKVFSGFISQSDTYETLVKALELYRDNLII